jgi:glycosyltransferase involved in cell wall biosynthesis
VLWFYKNVLPKVRRKRPETRFIVAGRDPTGEIISLTSDPQVEVTGTVPDVRPYLERATVSISPMISGSGIQNKVLEYMAAGVPCVSTSLACQALYAKPGKDILVADTAEDFANSLIEILEEPNLQYDLSTSGRRYVEKHHSWTKIGENLNGVYQNLSVAEVAWASTAPMA